MSYRTISVGHDPTGQPAESLSTKIRAQHHTRAADLQERLMISYPWPHTFATLTASQYEHFVVRVPPFSSKLRISFQTDAADGNLAIRYYGSGGNTDRSVKWARVAQAPKFHHLVTEEITLNPVTTSDPGLARLHFYASVAASLHHLEFEFIP